MPLVCGGRSENFHGLYPFSHSSHSSSQYYRSMATHRACYSYDAKSDYWTK